MLTVQPSQPKSAMCSPREIAQAQSTGCRAIGLRPAADDSVEVSVSGVMDWMR